MRKECHYQDEMKALNVKEQLKSIDHFVLMVQLYRLDKI